MEAALSLKRTKQNWQLQESQELQDSLVLCPLSFHDCAWGHISYVFPKRQTWCHPHGPSSWHRSGILFGKENDPCVLLPLTLGLTWHPGKSPSHLYVLGQVKSAWLSCSLLDPANSVCLFAKTSALCHVSWTHSTGHFLHGHVWPWCVHMCPHVCMCSLQHILLGHIPPSPLAINVPSALAMATICHFLKTWALPFRELAATAGQGLLCGTKCESIT